MDYVGTMKTEEHDDNAKEMCNNAETIIAER